MLRCNDCGNTGTFTGEVYVAHWCKIDNEGKVIQLDDMQGDGEINGAEHADEYVECSECYSENVDRDA